MKYAALALVLAALAGCASDPSKRAQMQESDPSKGIICTYQVPTGSSIRERKCTTPEERERERQEAAHQIAIEPGKGNAR